jgi:hypothetical protein
MYAFLLKDNAGAVRRQMVTPEVFERYAEGDYFNDLQSGPASGGVDSKIIRTAKRSATPFERMVNRAKAGKRLQLARRSQSASKPVAKLTPPATQRKSQAIRRSTTDLIVANATVIRKKAVATTASAERKAARVPAAASQTATVTRIPASAVLRGATIKTAAVATPMLPRTGAGTPEDPEIIFIPTRVR